jgi:hypothetical protein
MKVLMAIGDHTPSGGSMGSGTLLTACFEKSSRNVRKIGKFSKIAY